MSLLFSHDNRRIITGHSDGSVRVWTVDAFRLVREFRCCSGTWIRSLALTPDEQILAIGAQNGQILLWNIAEALRRDPPFEGVTRSLPGHYYGVSSLVFDSSGEYLLSSGDDQHVRRWNVRTGSHYEFSRAPQLWKAHRGMVKSVVPLNNGREAVSGAYWEGGTTKDYAGVAPPDHVLRLWDVDTGRPLRSYPLTWGVRCCIQVLNEGRKIAFLKASGWDENPRLHIFDLDSGNVEREFAPTMGEYFHAVAMHPDTSRFLISIGDGQYHLWDRRRAQVMAQLVSADEGWAVISPDGRMDFSEGFSRWPCRNNIQHACAGGTAASPIKGLLSRLMGSE